MGGHSGRDVQTREEEAEEHEGGAEAEEEAQRLAVGGFHGGRRHETRAG